MEKIYGLHTLQALLERAPQRVREIWLQSGRDDARAQHIVQLAAAAGVRLSRLERAELAALADGVHQGVVAAVEPAQLQNETFLEALLESLEEPALLLVLDGVTDPHNLGACLRSAEAAGAHAVIVPKDKSASLGPVVRKVASGAAELIPLVAVTNLARCLRGLKAGGVWLVGAAGEAEATIHEVDCRGPVALIMGAEGSGLRRLTRECCDYLARIPLRGTVASLNVSVATGICLFEVLRQRQHGADNGGSGNLTR